MKTLSMMKPPIMNGDIELCVQGNGGSCMNDTVPDPDVMDAFQP